MEVIIHGTKDGARIFYQTQNVPYSVFKDLRRTSNEDPKGAFAYSIKFIPLGCTYTKYVIVWDVLRGSMGYVAFSICLLNGEKLSGNDILLLIDQISEKYCLEYINENNLDGKKENWSFIDDIINQYKSKLHSISSDDFEDFKSGINEPAFIYYSDILELQKLIGAPFQDKYQDFEQVYFVAKELEYTPQNPLNALRHDTESNLTGKIDFENPPFRLKEFHGSGKYGNSIEIWANGRRRNNKDVIKKNDDIKIKISKNKYYKEIIEEGKLQDENILQFISIDEDNKKLLVKNDITLPAIKKTIHVDIKDSKGISLHDAELICSNNVFQSKPDLNNNTITFEGEELKEKCTLTAKKGNSISQTVTFIPEKQTGDVVLVLEEHLTVNFYAREHQNNQDVINNIEVRIKGLKIHPRDNVIEFIGDEINKTWRISISHNYYNTYSFDFCPAKDDNPKYIILKRSTGEKPQNQHGESERLKKPYILRKSVLIALAGLIFLIIISIGLYLSLFSSKSGPTEPQTANTQEITEYIEGIDLKLDKLNQYQQLYCKKIATVPEESHKSIWQKIFSYSSKEELPKEASQPDYCPKIANAIALRKAINSGKIDELKDKQYSEAQDSFKKAVGDIDDKFKSKIGEVMNDYSVSTMNLNAIADFISNLQKLLQIRDKLKMQTKDDLVNAKITAEGVSFEIDSIRNNIIDEINYKISNDKTKPVSKTENETNKVSKPKTETDPNKKAQSQKNSLNHPNTLEKEFWELVNSGNETKQSYKDLLSKYKTQGGDIINYLNKICKNSDSFKKFKDIDKRVRLEAKTLTVIDINQ